jgi:Protein of unknown function (DUF3048) N-terminal domain/Protein of unknown function (DUF3048) C-terminal domain
VSDAKGTSLIPRGRATAVLAAGLLGLSAGIALVTACGPHVRHPDIPPASSAPTTPPRPTPPPPPRTPGPAILAVKIDNAREARPARGIGGADLVYIEPVEGGASRIIAVFASQLPPVVGPVRSARETDLQLLPQFGHPTLAFSGAAPSLMHRIDRASLQDASAERVPRAYFRDKTRAAPHNMFVRPGLLPKGGEWPAHSQPQFGPAPAGGVPSSHELVRYRAATVAFDWSSTANRWLVSLDGVPAKSDSHRLAASTVVVQQVPVHQSAIRDVAGNPSPIADTVGHGHALVFRNGEMFRANWSRTAVDQGTTYTTPTGQLIPLEPGQVWTVLNPGAL